MKSMETIRKRLFNISIGISWGITILSFLKQDVYAQSGNAIQIGNLGQLLWDIVATIQFYSLPVMAISIAGIGIAMIFSGDDSARKENLRGWIVKILLGGVLVFCAATIAQIIKNSVASIG